jgi:tRNA threonylcarbamoyladenosine biosynthesis protein TsaB
LIVLALDTTTRGGSVAVADDDRVLALLPGDESRTHGERLPGEIARALDQARVTRDRIDLLAVATGPGAFTGLRIGLAAIQGLAMTLGKPVIGVSALEALAAQVDDSNVDLLIPWMDAQRGDVFATLIDRRSGATIETPAAANPQMLLDSWNAHLANRRAIFIGDAAARDAALITQAGHGKWETKTPSPLAPQIALIGRRRANNGEAGPPHKLEPIYVRRPDAEIERERRGRA